MTKPTSIRPSGTTSEATDVAGEIAALKDFTSEQLRAAWRRAYRVPPPPRTER